MTMCKRGTCDKPGETRGKYDGYCSLHCRDVDEAEREIEALRAENERLRKGLVHIQGMCGNPDAAQGCRNVIAKAKELLGDGNV